MSSQVLDMVMPFGKHKGKMVSEIPDGYLLTLYDSNKISGELKICIEENVKILKILKDRKTK